MTMFASTKAAPTSRRLHVSDGTDGKADSLAALKCPIQVLHLPKQIVLSETQSEFERARVMCCLMSWPFNFEQEKSQDEPLYGFVWFLHDQTVPEGFENRPSAFRSLSMTCLR
jgi:hypothetical protein